MQFDHRHHVRDDGIDCLYCHADARRTAYAGIPSTEVCMGCHAQVWPESIQLEPVRRSYYSGEPLALESRARPARLCLFQSRDAREQGRRLRDLSRARRPDGVDYQVAPLSMGWCLDCHRAPEPRLRPLAQVTSMDWQPPRRQQKALGKKLAALYRRSPADQLHDVPPIGATT